MSQYRGNEIFNEFAKMMLASGSLVATAEDKSTRSNIKEWSEDNKIKDKEYKDKIEALYGVRPNGAEDKGKDDGFASVLDIAHPMPLILCPSYDKVNGLVENIKERQDIMVGIVMKPQQAKLTQRRIAQELQSELLSIAFQTDQEEVASPLSKLADDCVERIEKTAVLPILAVVGVAAAVLGLIALVQNVDLIDQGVVVDTTKAMEAINAFKPTADDLSSQLDELVDGISYIHDLAVKVSEVKVEGSNLSESIASNSNQSAIQIIKEYKRVAALLADKITSTYLPLIKSHQHVEEGWNNDFWAGLKSVYHTFIPDEQHDVLKALSGLASSLTKSVAVMDEKQSAINNYVKDNHEKLLDQLKDESTKMTPTVPSPSNMPKTLMDQLKGNVPTSPPSPTVPKDTSPLPPGQIRL